MFDGSRQSNNFTANAGGVGSTARVAISDVALKSASIDEVKAVTGHEIGHYVLKHTWSGILFFAVLAMVLFWLAEKLYPRFARAFGSDAKIDDPRGVPVLFFLISVFAVAASPFINTFGRTLETQADMYSLETENRPDALASALVKTAEYRYPDPMRSRSSCSTITLPSNGGSGWQWNGRPRIRTRPLRSDQAAEVT
ncbi:M48 family metalloprotease [Sphingomonas daechungensis]|uniref:M48 family metalloprotease n=1 Tax=Sphingomonas daechungensis TaxID=1176646 RepID=UPI001CB8D2BB|nr:M48 family metalloprotease [Sphingomonas daechungensis]